MTDDIDTCQHDWRLFFGPVLKCVHCGSHTTVSADGKSKPILPPAETDNAN